ncbi:hypothetical protein T07_5501 [Trichinella nelsoni]|uniref:Uncharacterized protein n=1 Tax=Trichinella nelsoni TaxID=6336 RepID=A0A0V0RLP4_9BILA|nr:hypothetical protein T07_5501 [Trichinella nelsoni]
MDKPKIWSVKKLPFRKQSKVRASPLLFGKMECVLLESERFPCDNDWWNRHLRDQCTHFLALLYGIWHYCISARLHSLHLPTAVGIDSPSSFQKSEQKIVLLGRPDNL